MLSLLAATCLGFLVASFSSGRQTGVCGRLKSVRLRIKNYVIHVHHWLYGVFALAGVSQYSETHSISHEHVVYAFLIGLIIQGLTYRDFYKLIYRA